MKRASLGVVTGMIVLASTSSLSAVSIIEGYMDEQSYAAGDTMRFYVSTNARTFSIELIRVGSPDQVVATATGIPGESHIDGWSAAKQYWLDARWTVSYEWVVPDTWPTGCYFAKFIHESGEFTYFSFVIRQTIPGSTSRIAFVANFNTDCAYNTWGGASLYASNILPINRSISVGFSPAAPGCMTVAASSLWCAIRRIALWRKRVTRLSTSPSATCTTTRRCTGPMTSWFWRDIMSTSRGRFSTRSKSTGISASISSSCLPTTCTGRFASRARTGRSWSVTNRWLPRTR